MAGGIGSRFWPLSTTSKPKQFLDILGTGRTFIQQTFDRFSQIIPIENIYVVTNETYAGLTKEQLPELEPWQILTEPTMRNTAPCIAYATYKVLSKNPNANFVIAPSDHLITKEEAFLNVIQRGMEYTEYNQALLTIGIKPTRPETGYGYIQADVCGEIETGTIQKVKTFTEKPNIELAKVFMESGEFLWNSGIFMWKGSTIATALESHLPEIADTFIACNKAYYTKNEKNIVDHAYISCSSISIDYGIMEKANNVSVLCSEHVGWSDLGTWGSLYENLELDNQGNALAQSEVFLYDSSNNIINLPEGKIAIIQGLNDYIIAQTDQTLLICKKEEEQRIKQFVLDVKVEKGGSFI